MTNTVTTDLYEMLELSPNATFETIERMFRFQAKRFHPDAGVGGDREKFKQIVSAYETLRDPEKRAAYDAIYQRQQKEKKAIVMDADSTADDFAIRHRMLTLFYAQRRRNMNQPGVGISKLEELTGLPTEILEFHLWYFREKGWIQRELSGPLSITVAGVDEIESREKLRAESASPRIGHSVAASAIRLKPDAVPTHVAS